MAAGASAPKRRSAARWRWLIARVLFMVMLGAAVLLLVLDRTRPEMTATWRAVANDSLTPMLGTLTTPVRWVAAGVNSIKSYLIVRDENERLRAENDRLRQLAERTLASERESTTLRSLLRLAEPGVRVVATARVVGTSGASMLDSALLTAGRDAGLKPDMPVRDAGGIVGRLIQVGARSSRVLLVTDVESRVPVRVLRTGETAIAAGLGNGLLELQFLRPDADLRRGDQVLTSGHGRLFPPNVPVGEVIDLSGERPRLKPVAALSRLSYVLVLEPFEQIDLLIDPPNPPAP